MKKHVVSMKGLLSGLLIVLMTMGILVSGCRGGSKGIEILERVPFDVSALHYVNMESLRSMPELRDRIVRDDLNAPGVLRAEWFTGIRLDNELLVGWARLIVASGYEADMYEGSLDLDAVRACLKERNCVQDEYRAVELWYLDDIAWTAVADGVVVVGGEKAVKDCIDVMTVHKNALSGGGDLRTMIDRLPSEVYQLTAETGNVESEGLEAWGATISNMDADTLKRTEVYQFKDKQSATDARDKIKDSIDQDPGWTTLTVRQQKEFVEATAKMGTEDFISSSSES